MDRLKSLIRYYYRRIRAFIGKGLVVEKEVFVVESNNNLCKNPIFIIGIHRSGTSLLRRVINSHSEIACPPESFIFTNYTEILNNDLTLIGLDNLGFNKSEAINGLSKCAGYFHEIYRRSKNKNRWADKTPQNVFHLSTLDSLFPEAQYIVILRNPLDIAFSICNRKWDFGWQGADLIEKTCNYINDASENIMEFVSNNANSCLVIKYEDLVSNPETIVRGICDFLNENFDARMLHFYNQSHDDGTEDPIVKGTKGFVPSVNNWHSFSKEEIKRINIYLEDSINRFGYNHYVE